MIKYIENFCKDFIYPTDATYTILEAYEEIINNQNTSKIFNEHIIKYRESTLDFDKMLSDMEKISLDINSHIYTIKLLFYICISRHMKVLYSKNNINEKIFYDTMCDLRYKLYECYKIHKVWGTFVAEWFPPFFKLEMFALGRLQFQIYRSSISYQKNDCIISPDDLVLSTHIPSSGPLHTDDCIQSFKMAANFFADRFDKKSIVFFCSSWLLFPENKNILPKNSNINKFMELFDIIDFSEEKDNYDCWRIFGMDYPCDLSILPQETTLQKNYYNWFSKGNKMGSGIGIKFIDNPNS